MADNYLEKHYEDYLKRKAAWEKNKGKSVRNKPFVPEEPEDESL
ncbi:MAG: dehydrogenase [Bacteroidaceae bacterium]|nr:dehydrogenase [Bacteroidaceae bacterium]